MAAIMRRASDLVWRYSERLRSVTQFVQRDEGNVRLYALTHDLLPIANLALRNGKRLKCALSLSSTFPALIWSKIQTSPPTVNIGISQKVIYRRVIYFDTFLILHICSEISPTDSDSSSAIHLCGPIQAWICRIEACFDTAAPKIDLCDGHLLDMFLQLTHVSFAFENLREIATFSLGWTNDMVTENL
jgi:hypothetical protein